MRCARLLLVACLASCSLTSTGTGGECRIDSQCGEEVCANSGECLPRASVRDVVVRWSVSGVAADDDSCAGHPDLYLQFDGDYGDTLRVAPVPCRAGAYRVGKLPRRYQRVELGAEGGASESIAIDASSSQLQIDLF